MSKTAPSSPVNSRFRRGAILGMWILIIYFILKSHPFCISPIPSIRVGTGTALFCASLFIVVSFFSLSTLFLQQQRNLSSGWRVWSCLLTLWGVWAEPKVWSVPGTPALLCCGPQTWALAPALFPAATGLGAGHWAHPWHGRVCGTYPMLSVETLLFPHVTHKCKAFGSIREPRHVGSKWALPQGRSKLVAFSWEPFPCVGWGVLRGHHLLPAHH